MFYSQLAVVTSIVCCSAPLAAMDDLKATGVPVSIAECVRKSECYGVLLIPMRVASHRVIGLVDTGSDASAIDESVFEAVKDEIKGEWTLKPAHTNRSTVSILSGSAPLSLLDGPERLVECARTKLRMEKFILFDAIAGMNLLDTSPFRIRAGSSFARMADDQMPAEDCIPLLQNSGRIRFNADIGSGSALVYADTGSNTALSLESHVLQFMTAEGSAVRFPDLDAMPVGIDGIPRKAEAYFVREATIGGITFRNVLTRSANQSYLGMPILRHFDMTVDKKSHRLWLDPLPSAKTATFAPGGTGFNFWFEQDGRMMVLENMRPGGPAEIAGIKPGDEILEIDGKPVADFTFYTATDRFSEAGTTLHLKYRRNDINFETSMVLKHRVPYPPVWPDDGKKVTEEADDSKQNVGPKK